MRIARTSLILLGCFLLTGLSSAFAADEKAKKITYEDHVKPIFRARCFSCHNTSKKSSDLDLTSYTALMTGGASGAAVEPGAPDDSYLFMVVNHDSEPYMPPKADKIPEPEIKTIRDWIEGGALENSSSKARKKKARPSMALKGPVGGKPEGPPPMPDVLNLEPYVTPKAKTAVTALATSPWAPLVAVAGLKQVTLYHSLTLQPLGVLPFPEGIPHVLKFSRNGSLLLAGGGRGSLEGKVVVWDVKTGNRIFTVGDELDTVLAADISADQSMIALGGPQRMIRVYSTADGEQLYEIKKHTDWVYSLEFSPDGVLLATSDRAGGLHVWEAHTGRSYLTLNGHKKGVTAVSWRSDANVLASCSEDVTVKLWEMENGKQIKSWNAHGSGTASVEFCRDGRLVSCGRDRIAKLWDQNGKQLRAFEAFGDLALRVTHCDETDRVVSGDWTGAIRVWNAKDGKRLGELNQSPPKLDDRIAAATQQTATLQKQFDAAAAAATAAQTKLNQITAALNKAKTDSATFQKSHDTMVAEKTALTKTLAALNAEVKTLTTTNTTLKKSVPLLKTAFEQAGIASKALPADKDLAGAATMLKTKFDQRNSELAANTKVLTDKNAVLVKSNARMKELNTGIAGVVPKLNAAKKQVTTLTPQQKPAQDAYAKAKAAADSGNGQLQAAKAQATLWAEYKMLRDELNVLQTRQQAFEEQADIVAEAQAGVDDANAVVKTAEAQVATHKKSMADMATKKTGLQKQMTDLTTKVATAKTQVDKVKATVPVLQASLVKAQEAGKTLGMPDEQITALVTQIQSVINAKNAAMGTLTKAIADDTAAITKAQQQMQEIDKQQVALKATLQSSEQAVAKAKSDMAPLQQKLTTAQQSANAAKASLDAAAKVVESRRQRIRPALNLSMAS